ncbi:replication protein A 32 kDa subunit [Silurus asotus]|uniref:Replication protein A 32 kDa subunit n=1 Tax=Silurus asotus TaxID=30991 RepID=A0AAD5A1K9_SILAS|nr:replication protein A 32 kDa subunit [Silurus asotus]
MLMWSEFAQISTSCTAPDVHKMMSFGTLAAGILRIMPCTVSQLLSAREHRDSFILRDVELNQVSVLGVIRRTKMNLTHRVHSVDDMTGPPLDVKHWMNIQDVNMNHPVIPIGTYVKAVGTLRSFQNHRILVAFNIRPVDDMNEITSHMLEVVQAHMQSDSSLCKRAIPTSATDPATAGFTANQKQAFTLIKSCRLAEGISTECLGTALKNLSSHDIRTCLQFLINEGHIFTTIDDDHFKCTNA